MTQAEPGIEIERRFLVNKLRNPDILHSLPNDHIMQGYPVTLPGKVMRIRVKNSRETIVTVKTGAGLRRTELEAKIPDFLTGLAALDACVFMLSKTRYTFDGWELDVFEGPLKGLILLERELESEDEELPPFPSFLEIDREVTDSMNNLALAEASTLLTEGADPTQLFAMMSAAPLPMIVLTGGPCSGKSTSMNELREQYPEFAFVPEVATIVIAHVGITPPIGDEIGMAKFQKLIYAVQRAFEHAAQDQAIRQGKKAIILDRGSMDNAAYLEGGVEAFTQILRTTSEAEYARYQGVVCLSQPSKEIYEQMRYNNSARSEDYAAAEALSNRIKQSWQYHPNCRIIPKYEGWENVSRAIHEQILELVTKR